jgi:uncharacterized membrane protein YfcA
MSGLLVAATVVFVLAGFVKGMTGLGLPTVAIGLLSLAMPPAEAAALLVIPTLVTNIWQLAAGPSLRALLRRLAGMMGAICLGTWLAGGRLITDGAGHAGGWLGVALIVYAMTGLLKLRFHVPSRAERWLSPAIGAVTGLVTAATGVLTIPAVPYLQGLGLERDDLVQALGLSFTVSTLALSVVLARDGVLHLSNATTSALAVAPALVGMGVGQWLRKRIRPEIFRLCFFLGLLMLGADLAVRGLG